MTRHFAQHHMPTPPELIYTSPLKRSRQTANLISQELSRTYPIPPPKQMVLDSLVERSYGVYEGKRLCELAEQEFASAEDHIEGVGVELWPTLQRRVLEALTIIAAGPSEALVIVHGGWYKAMQRLHDPAGSTDNLSNLDPVLMDPKDLRLSVSANG